MAKGNSVKEVKMLMPQVKAIFCKYVEQLRNKKVPLEDLIFTKRISKESDDYVVNTVETDALRLLKSEGKSLHAGEVLQYVITDYQAKRSRKRAIPIDLINSRTSYDSKRYLQLLLESCNSLTEPFGYTLVS